MSSFKLLGHECLFADGPVAGTRLALRRAPLALRVVRGRVTGVVDALNEIEDVARPSEEVFVYLAVTQPGYVHIRASKGQGGVFLPTLYRFLPVDQPADYEVRTNEAWTAWCHLNKRRLRELSAELTAKEPLS